MFKTIDALLSPQNKVYSMSYHTGDIVVYQDDQTDRNQKIKLIKKTTEPRWASEEDNVWEFEVVEDGPLFLEGEISFIREGDIVEVDE